MGNPSAVGFSSFLGFVLEGDSLARFLIHALHGELDLAVVDIADLGFVGDVADQPDRFFDGFALAAATLIEPWSSMAGGTVRL